MLTMMTPDCLVLRMARLKPTDEWLNSGPDLCFVFPHVGAGKLIAGSLSQSLAAGDVLVLNGAAGGKLGVAKGGEFAFWFFSVSLEHLFPLFGADEISLLRSVADDFKAARQYPASDALARQCHRLLSDAPPPSGLDHRSQLLRIVAAILTVEFKQAHTRRHGFARLETQMVQIFESLTSEEILNLSVGELADKFSCSRRHLNRLFHEHFGFSLASLRMEMRMVKAVSLLRDPDIKIINVAEGCGFNHLGLFNTCFKRRFLKSPGQWRKLNDRFDSPSAVPDSGLVRTSSLKSSDSRNGRLDDEPPTSHAAQVVRELALNTFLKTNGGSKLGRKLPEPAPRPAREGRRRPSAP